MRNPSQRGTIVAFGLFLAAFAIDLGCEGDDVTLSNDDAAASDASVDASPDDATRFDSAALDAAIDSPFDAGPPAHVVFLTDAPFSPPNGDLITFADGGGLLVDGGVSSVKAADSICQAAADDVGLAGTFVALIASGSEDGLSRIRDSDGPWALIDRTPIAENAADLVSGRWHATLALTQKNRLVTGATVVWGKGTTQRDCGNWSFSGFSDAGAVGLTSFVGADALDDSPRRCNFDAQLYCAQVGSGGAPNVYPPIPAGGKLAFVTDVSLPGNFGTGGPSVIDGGALLVDAGAHDVGDAVCSQVARGHGKTGIFRAWLATSTEDARTYFSDHAMNGPWYRADGVEIAASSAELERDTPTAGDGGVRQALVLDPSGHFVDVSSYGPVWTGSDFGGAATGPSCTDFTVGDDTQAATGGSDVQQHGWAFDGIDFNISCASTAPIYCFEE
jgi:hypothetical protein